MILTTRDLLTLAQSIFAARETDLRLTAVHRAQAGECALRVTDALNDLRANNTLPPNRVNPTLATFRDRIGVMGNIDRIHPDDIAPGELYNGIDAMRDFVWCVETAVTEGDFYY